MPGYVWVGCVKINSNCISISYCCMQTALCFMNRISAFVLFPNEQTEDTGHIANGWWDGSSLQLPSSWWLQTTLHPHQIPVPSKGTNACCFPILKKEESTEICSDFYSQGELLAMSTLLCHRYKGGKITLRTSVTHWPWWGYSFLEWRKHVRWGISVHFLHHTQDSAQNNFVSVRSRSMQFQWIDNTILVLLCLNI